MRPAAQALSDLASPVLMVRLFLAKKTLFVSSVRIKRYLYVIRNRRTASFGMRNADKEAKARCGGVVRITN